MIPTIRTGLNTELRVAICVGRRRATQNAFESNVVAEGIRALFNTLFSSIN